MLYLRQQKRQLDESWRLLDNMEQQQQQQQDVGGASRVAVETAQSGTIPTSLATGPDGESGRRRERGRERERGRGRERGVGTTGVDLSSLYDHCMCIRVYTYTCFSM